MSQCSIGACAQRAAKRGMCGMHYLRWWRHGDSSFVSLRSCRKPAIDRLLARAVRRDPRPDQTIGCLEIARGARGGKHGKYRTLQVDGEVKLAHRVAFEAAYGPIPAGKHVCHRCDNEPCIEATHLFAGTPLENTRDMIAKGRQVVLRGEAAPWSKLTAADVLAIRASKETTRAAAARLGVSQKCIDSARRGETWQAL